MGESVRSVKASAVRDCSSDLSESYDRYQEIRRSI
jgi:hypothetical protein